MSDDELVWLDRGGGRAEGPFTRRQVRSMIAAGELQPEARVCGGGARTWRSASAPPLRPVRRRRPVGFWILLGGVSAAFWVLLAVIIITVGLVGFDYLPARSVRYIWPAMGAGMALLTAAGAAMWWRAAARLEGRPELAAAIRVSVGLASIIGATGAIHELRLTSWVVQTAESTAAWAFEMRSDPAGRRLLVAGQIGPGFGRAVEQGMAALRDPVTVEITSSGGLTAEALRAARAIAERRGATVIVRGWCESACMIVLMSAEERKADYFARLSFHAIAPVAHINDRMLNWSVAQEGEKIDAYLRRSGVDQAIIEETNRLGPQRLNAMSALTAFDQGLLTGLVNRDLPITAQAARRHRWALDGPGVRPGEEGFGAPRPADGPGRAGRLGRPVHAGPADPR